MTNEVAIKQINNYQIENVQQAIDELFSTLGAEKLFKGNPKVLIKVNAGLDANPDLAITTHPAVVQAVVNALTKFGASCIVADSPLKQYSLNGLDKIYFNTGLLEAANSTNCQLNHNLAVSKIEIPAGLKTKSAMLLDVVNQVDLIVNIGKLSIDKNLGVMAVTAGVFGLVPADLKQLYLNRFSTVEDFNNFVIDIIMRLQKKLCLNVFDGIVAVEADASQRMLSCLAASENPYSLDAVVNEIIGRDLADSIVKTASKRGFVDFEKPYKMLDADISKFLLEDFDFGEQNNLSNIHSSTRQQKAYFNKYQQRVTISASKCKGCERCAHICPTKAITMKFDKNGELFAKIDYSKCIFCNKCHTACPYSVVDIKTPVGYKILTHSATKYNTEDNKSV